MAGNILALDPGTDKLGLAVLSRTGEVLNRKVISRLDLSSEVARVISGFSPEVVVMGNGTGSSSFQAELNKRNLIPSNCKMILVDEYRTSEEARRMYLAEHRTGWRKIIPLGLQTPDKPYDDYVAVILGKRYLASTRES